MSEPLSLLLFAVFSVHLAVFLSLYYRQKKRRHMLFMLVFFFLVSSYAFRLWGAHLNLYGHAAHQYLRLAAWIFTAIAVAYWIRQKLKN